MYRIEGWSPDPGQMGGCGFSIILTPAWKDAVSKSDITQDKIDELLQTIGKSILNGHGRDIDNARMMPCYLRVKWGEWGPEHITVPGNACGLDIMNNGICDVDEKSLNPHNVDSISQASMILTIFIEIATILHSEVWLRNNNQN